MACDNHDIESGEHTHEGEDCGSIEPLEKVGAVDVILAKLISRKLLVFGVATGLLMWYGLDPDTWGLIAMIYVGGQSVIDTVKIWKHG
tara:strand:- start:1231 stop:1494 length:264 start_codon:yes stop_codon:yes gene_type:complete